MMLILGMYVIPMQCYSQSDEKVIGSISGKINAGETYELYKWYKTSLFDILGGWKSLGWRDKTVTYSDEQIYEKCMDEARSQYGRYYPDFYLRDYHVEVETEELPDTTWYTQEVGTGNECKKKLRERTIYKYSAKVVVKQ